MLISEKSSPLPIINASSLVCCLYTLSNKNKFFKKLNLKKDIFLNINNKNDYFLADLENFNEFYKLLNKLSLRIFAYKLIRPLVNKNSVQDIWEDAILFKKYLQKFKYNYRLYFFYQNGNYHRLPTDEEMNMLAIKSLFFIVGI